MLFDPLERNVFSIPLRIRVGILAKPLLEECFHRAAVRVTELNVAEVVPMIEEQ